MASQPISSFDDFEPSRLYETYGSDLDIVQDADPNLVWTLVDTDNGRYVIAGFHIVNRVGYYITRHPWHDEMMEFKK